MLRIGLLFLGLLLVDPLWSASWRGDFSVTAPESGLRAGQQAQLQLSIVQRNKDGSIKSDDPKPVAERQARFWLVPYRFNLFSDASVPLQATASGGGGWTVQVPAVRSDWYLLVATIEDDEGRVVDPGQAVGNRHRKAFVHRQVVALRGSETRHLRLHTERARCVFSPGEEIRLYLSARGSAGVHGAAQVHLVGVDKGLTGQTIIATTCAAAPGKEQTQVFDWPASATAGIAPGDYALVAKLDGEELDRYRVRFVSPHTPSGGGRWAHTMPFGTGPGFDASWAHPEKLQGYYTRTVQQVIKRIHKANFWVNFFANAYPQIGPSQKLPAAGAADMPPAAAAHRPSLTNAFYQLLMSEQVALGICAGYGEDYRAETYMPLPTVIDEDMAVLGRKYLTAGMGAAQFPHFVSLYTDYYGHMDFTGAGEISGEEYRELKDALWEQATEAAGIAGKVQRPYRFEFDRKKMSKEFQALLKDKAKSKAWSEFLKAKQAEHGNDKKWFSKHYTTEADRMKVWRAAWQAAGVGSAPEPPRYVPAPELDKANSAKVGKDAAYAYASYALRGVERCYARITGMVEEELPAVFTIHNKGTMNHASVGHAWTGIRTPNVDPAYCFGASAISVSEWNLDSVPKPYFLPTFYVQPQVDAGRPVYQCGLWKQMGQPQRFMRDAVFWAGRQVQVYFDQAGNMCWGHQGADQSTYASNDRMAAVGEFLSTYSDLFNKLQAVREVGLYVGPYGGPWGTGVTRGHYIAMIAALMSGYQVHMVSHGSIPDRGLERYPILFAPSMHSPDFYPFEKQAFKAYLAQGGRIVASQAPDYYHPEDVYSRYGISMKQVPDIDSRTGQPKKNRDGSTKMRREWTATSAQWAAVTREYIWGEFKEGVTAVPLNVHQLYTHRDADGKPATRRGGHWTGHHKWGPYRGSALDQYTALQQGFAGIKEPVVKKDQPEVFVSVCTPEHEGSKGTYVFASNWTQSNDNDFYAYKVPQGFFNSAALPVQTELSILAPGTAAVYDCLRCKKLPFTRDGDRVVFKADLGAVEGRVFALLPAEVADVRLTVPAQAQAGETVTAGFSWVDAGGEDIKALGSVRLMIADAQGRLLVDMRRAVQGDGLLPSFTVPGNAGDQLRVFVYDTISGFRSMGTIRISGQAGQAEPAPAVTVYRGDRIHEWLAANKRLRIVVDTGALSFKDGKVTVSRANPDAAQERTWAQRVAKRLQGVGFQVDVIDNQKLFETELWSHPWQGKMATARQRSTVPNRRSDEAVLLVGHPERNRYLRMMDRAAVAGRSLGRDNAAADRAVLAWAPKAFSPLQDTVILAARSEAGLDAGVAELLTLSKARRDDSYYDSREHLRSQWLPSEVQEWKQRSGVIATTPRSPQAGTPAETRTKPGWTGIAELLGTAIFCLDANEQGVAVGTKSWVKPVGLLDPDGKVLAFEGGWPAVTPRDVGLSADGKTLAGGFALAGRARIWRDGKQLVDHTTGIAHSSDPYAWDAYKDSDRHLASSPDHRTFIIPASDAIIAYDAANGAERWRIPTATSAQRSKGTTQPEMAFSPDGKRVLLSVMRDHGQTTATFTVTKMKKDADGRYNKRDTYTEEVAIPVRSLAHEVQLVDVASGKPIWRRVTQMTLEDLASGEVVWSPGKAAVAYEDLEHGRWQRWTAVDEAPPMVDGKPFGDGVDRLVIPFWHLYSSVGPQAKWSILAARAADVLLLDEQGQLLRRFEERHLPRDLNPGKLIPITWRSGKDPSKLLAFAAEGRQLHRYRLHIGSLAQRQAARELEDRNRETLRRIDKELRDRKNYGNFGKQDYLDAFGKQITVPPDLKKMLLARMKQVPAERRAGRKRDYKFFTQIIERIEHRLYVDAKATLDAAVSLESEGVIDVPDLICDADVDPELTRAFVSTWDGRLLAIDLTSGATSWEIALTGGARVKVVAGAGAVYAGGSRGDVYRIQMTDGEILWRTNVSEASNAFDP